VTLLKRLHEELWDRRYLGTSESDLPKGARLFMFGMRSGLHVLNYDQKSVFSIITGYEEIL